MSFKAYRAQVSLDSKGGQGRQTGLKKVGTHFNPSDVLTKYVPASVFGQYLPHLNIFKVHSKSIHLILSQLQDHRRRRQQRCQSSCSPSPTTTLMLKKSFVSSSDKLQGVSEELSHLVVEGAETKIKEIFRNIQLFIAVVTSFIMTQRFKKIRERE